jgi:broad specificity phosphatase PhoE
MTTRIFLVRHGETTLSAEDRFAGSTDVPLGPNGRFQAERLAERLADDPIAAAYCSPMQRTVETAAIVSRPHGIALIHHAGLREIDHGRWEGLRRSEVETRFPEEYAAWEEDPYTFAPTGGESGVQVVARALPAIREIVVAHPGHNVLVVSHKATIRLIVASLLGFDERGYRDRLDQSPASLNVLDFKSVTRARLMLFNDISHYAGEPARSAGRLSKAWSANGPTH